MNIPPTKLIKLREVLALTTLSKSSVYDFINQGRFPKPVSLGARSVAWIEGEVLSWIEERANAR